MSCYRVFRRKANPYRNVLHQRIIDFSEASTLSQEKKSLPRGHRAFLAFARAVTAPKTVEFHTRFRLYLEFRQFKLNFRG